jgi:hypothetical protein
VTTSRTLLAAALLLVPAAATAQTMRAFTTARPASGESLLRATVDFGGGRFSLGPASDSSLYRALIRYDAERYAPVQRYNPHTGVLRIGVQAVGAAGVRVTSRAQLEQVGEFQFSREVPLSLEANLGASEATFDLGGLTLSDLTVRTGATRSTVDFSRPTRGDCRSATFSLGAGQLDVRHAAQSGCALITVTGGVSGATLDFGGTWRRNTSLVAELTMGSLTLRIPRGTGVEVRMDRFLAPFGAKGFERKGQAWITPGFADAPHKLRVELKTAMAGVEVEWIDR